MKKHHFVVTVVKKSKSSEARRGVSKTLSVVSPTWEDCLESVQGWIAKNEYNLRAIYITNDVVIEEK